MCRGVVLNIQLQETLALPAPSHNSCTPASFYLVEIRRWIKNTLLQGRDLLMKWPTSIPRQYNSPDFSPPSAIPL